MLRVRGQPSTCEPLTAHHSTQVHISTRSARIDRRSPTRTAVHRKPCLPSADPDSREHAFEDLNRRRSSSQPSALVWIDATQASPDALAAVIQHCPTGALHFRRKDGGADETAPVHNEIRVSPDGPIYVRSATRSSYFHGSHAFVLVDERGAVSERGTTDVAAPLRLVRG